MKTKILVIAAILLSFSAFAENESDEILKARSILPENQRLTTEQELINAMDVILGNSKRPKGINTDISKATDIFGTWILSYTVGSIRYTDKLVLDKTSTASNGNIYATGKAYPNQGNTSSALICAYDPAINAPLDGDYICMINDFGFNQQYVFRFSSNTVISGYYGIGTTITNAALSIFQKDKPITGYRINNSLTTPSNPAPTPLPTSEDTYNPSTGDLSLPKVKVGSTYYNAILNTKDGNTFTLKSSTKN